MIGRRAPARLGGVRRRTGAVWGNVVGAINASAALHWLAPGPPNVDEVKQALARIVDGVTRADDIIRRIRDLIKKEPSHKESVNINEAVRDVIELTRAEATKYGVSVQAVLGRVCRLYTQTASSCNKSLNLIVNGIEAMGTTSGGPRALLVSTAAEAPDSVAVAVRDFGPGLPEVGIERVFDPFYTTKATGLGIGLSICRSIVDAHGGQLWRWRTNLSARCFSLQFPLAAPPRAWRSRVTAAHEPLWMATVRAGRLLQVSRDGERRAAARRLNFRSN